ncbi:MAG: diguanylate cyclase [Nitrospinae bacterium]|nr:diguanylate cyclase [Nitrospinota bacterium]
MAGEPIKLLLIEDAQADVKLIERALDRSDLNVTLTHATSGAEALSVLQEERFDLALLDYSLPGQTGLEMLPQIIEAGCDVIMITANGNEAVALEAMEQGAINYLVKSPETLDLLPTIIRHCLTSFEPQKRLAESDKLVHLIIENALGATIGFVRDITEREEVEQKMEVLATTDALTKLYNRAYFTSKLEEEFQWAEGYNALLSLMLIEIDHFKTVKDTYGHQAGDAYLEAFAGLVARSVRKVDTVARYGGEELAIILPNTDLDETMALAERLRKEVEALDVPFGDHVIRSTVSIGVASYPEGSAKTAEMFLREADRALCAAQEAGRNGVVLFHEGMTLSS